MPALEVDIPIKLKKKLINDWENITKSRLLIALPRKKGERISDILQDYKKFAVDKKHPLKNKQAVCEMMRGLTDYFNQALPVTLLYKVERPQFSKLQSMYKDLPSAEIYGVQHLCRLFVKLPQLLNPEQLDDMTRIALKMHIEGIMAFILEHGNKYFINTKFIRSTPIRISELKEIKPCNIQLLFGYFREARQTLLPQNDIYYDIPPLTVYVSLAYYHLE